jgi:hypothetical protein
MDGENAAIHLFNIDRLAFVRNAPVKHQCSGDYFYGQDEKLEKAIRFLEGSYGATLSAILRPRVVLDEGHRGVLRRFWLFQYMRTEAASRRSVEMQEGMAAAIGEPKDSFGATIKEAVQIAMHVYVDEMDLIDDLKVCLIRNRTDIPFVTSDDPAAMTNRWHFEDGRVRGKSPGLGSAGAIMLLPLSPEVLCVIYDGDVYCIPHINGWVDVKREADIEAFNQHQFLNCTANIYFRDWGNHLWVHDEFFALRPLRPAARYRVNYAVYDGSDGDTERFRAVDRVGASTDGRALIHGQSILAKPSVWPRQIAWRTSGSAYTNGTGVGYIRRRTIDRRRSGGFQKVRTR